LDILDANTTRYEDSALDLLEIQAGRWPYEAAADANIDLLSQYILTWLP
jgi:hypothetical protein